MQTVITARILRNHIRGLHTTFREFANSHLRQQRVFITNQLYVLCRCFLKKVKSIGWSKNFHPSFMEHGGKSRKT